MVTPEGTENQKNAARAAVQRALKTGRLKKKPCRRCGSSEAVAHHFDYSKPLDVIWVCADHHGEEHQVRLEVDAAFQSAIWDFIRQFPNFLTRESYAAALSRFIAGAKLNTLAEFEALSRDKFQQACRTLSEKFAPGTVKLTLIVCKRFAEFLREDHPLLAFKYKAPHSPPPDWNVLAPGEAHTVLLHVHDKRDRAVLVALALQGWRASELANLKWGDFTSGSNGAVVSFIGKRGKPQTQRVKSEVLTAAMAWANGRTESTAPFIAAEECGSRHLTRFEIYKLVTAATGQLGHKVTPHGLRATFISNTIARKGIEAARQTARHENLETTRRYSRWQLADDEDIGIEDL